MMFLFVVGMKEICQNQEFIEFLITMSAGTKTDRNSWGKCSKCSRGGENKDIFACCKNRSVNQESIKFMVKNL